MSSLHSAEWDTVDRFLHPSFVALIGRINRSRPDAEVIAREAARWGPDGFAFVNPSGGSIGGNQIYRSLDDLPRAADLAVVTVGQSRLEQTLRDCARNGVRHIVMFTDGFAEAGEEGRAAQRSLQALVAELRLRLLGPNTNTNAFEPMPQAPRAGAGRIGLITQSGNQGRPLAEAAHLGVYLSRWVAVGNEADLSVADFISYFAEDQDTAVIACYVEGFTDGAKLRQALGAAAAARKPVVCLKIGRTEAGRRMAASHTGHLVGDDGVVDALFRQYGVIRVDDIDELMETAALAATLAGRAAGAVAVYGASGGVTTLLAEIAEREGLSVPLLSVHTQAAIRGYLPPPLSVSNPVDNGMLFLMKEPLDRRAALINEIAADEAIDIVAIANNMGQGAVAEAVADDLLEVSRASTAPVLTVWNSPAASLGTLEQLVLAGIPVFRSARNAMRALARYEQGRRRLDVLSRTPARLVPQRRPARPGTAGSTLSSESARTLLVKYGVRLIESRLAKSAADAAAHAQSIGGTVALKIESPDFPHRSEYGLVALGISGPEAASAAFERLIARALAVDPVARIEGVSVQTQVAGGTEMLIGGIVDPVLGPAVVVGAGGVYAEVLEDVVICPVPCDAQDVADAIQRLRVAPLLAGFRGTALRAVGSLTETVLAIGALMLDEDMHIKELDLNPVIVGPDEAVAVDWLITAEDDGER
jgi:acyl-CoA synthetase (NDP forming)